MVLDLKSELTRIAEVAVGEAVEKSEARDPVEVLRRGGNANRGNIFLETEQRNLNGNQINRMRACVGSLQSNCYQRRPATQQTIGFFEKNLKRRLGVAGPGVRQQCARRPLASLHECEDNFNHWPLIFQWPSGPGHGR